MATLAHESAISLECMGRIKANRIAGRGSRERTKNRDMEKYRQVWAAHQISTCMPPSEQSPNQPPPLTQGDFVRLLIRNEPALREVCQRGEMEEEAGDSPTGLRSEKHPSTGSVHGLDLRHENTESVPSRCRAGEFADGMSLQGACV